MVVVLVLCVHACALLCVCLLTPLISLSVIMLLHSYSAKGHLTSASSVFKMEPLRQSLSHDQRGRS